jgi:hypothetical protein
LPEHDELCRRLEVGRRARSHGQLRETDEQRDDEQHPRSRLANQLDDHVVDLIRRAGRERAEARHEHAPKEESDDKRDRRRHGAGQPGLNRVVKELARKDVQGHAK